MRFYYYISLLVLVLAVNNFRSYLEVCSYLLPMIIHLIVIDNDR